MLGALADVYLFARYSGRGRVMAVLFTIVVVCQYKLVPKRVKPVVVPAPMAKKGDASCSSM